jgi:hypothetical protein
MRPEGRERANALTPAASLHVASGVPDPGCRRRIRTRDFCQTGYVQEWAGHPTSTTRSTCCKTPHSRGVLHRSDCLRVCSSVPTAAAANPLRGCEFFAPDVAVIWLGAKLRSTITTPGDRHQGIDTERSTGCPTDAMAEAKPEDQALAVAQFEDRNRKRVRWTVPSRVS